MYQTQQQPQPHLIPLPTPTPIQPDAFEQASRLIDLIDKLNNRRSGGNIEPGQSQTSMYNSGMFQASDPQAIAMQELLLRNPQLLTQIQQQQPQQLQQLQQTQQPQQQNQSEIVTKLQNENQHLKQTLAELHQATAEYVKAGYFSQVLANGLVAQIEPLAQQATVGGEAIKVMNALIEEREALHEVNQILQSMILNPYYLLYHGFELWDKAITAKDGDFVNLLSTAYMKLISNYEEKLKQTTGKYSPEYTSYLQQEINNGNIQPTQVKTPQNVEVVTALKYFAENLDQPGFAKQLQRQHSLIRQQQTVVR